MTWRVANLAFAGLLLATGHARASSFQLREGDPDWLANAFAGDAAKAYDAGTAWNNPAGMTRLSGDELDQAANYFDPGVRFHGADYVNGTRVTGYSGGDAAPPAVTAGFEYVHSFSQDLKFGLAVEAPFGLRIAYPDSFVGRYQALVSSIVNFQVTPSLAYRLTPQLSIGGGPVVSYLHARLTQGLNTTAFIPDGGTSIVDIRGDGTAAGYQLGALYEVTPDFRVGVDYHSRISFALGGKQSVFEPPLIAENPLVNAVLQGLNAHIKAQITLPDVATISTYYNILPNLAFLTTAQWTHWSLIQNISIKPAGAVETTPIDFRNTWMGSIGMNWQPKILPRLTLQAGLLYDQGANTNTTRGPRLPDEDRLGPGTGFSYALTAATTLRLAYLHEFADGQDHLHYSNGFPGAGTLIGTSNNNADVITAGLTMKF